MARLYLCIFGFLATAVLDVASGVTLYLFQNQWSFSPSIFEQATDFTHECADVMFLALGRVLTVTVLGIAASWAGTVSGTVAVTVWTTTSDGSVYVSLPPAPVLDADLQFAQLKVLSISLW